MAVITPKSRQIINNKLPNFDIGNYIKPIVGRVEGIILGENTPNADLYSKYGKQYGIGTIFYTLYSSDGSTNISTVTEGELLNGALVLPARPFFPNDKQFPLLGELVYLVTLPNAKSVTEIDKEFSYYLGPINIWNNSQSNPLFTDQQIFLGKSFSQRNDIPNINIFEGDRLIKARYNSAIRFSSSNRSNKNYWNISKKSNDQIIIISNGYNTNSDFHTEDINKDDSTIVLAFKAPADGEIASTLVVSVVLAVRPFNESILAFAVLDVSTVLYASTIALRCPNFARAMSDPAFRNVSGETGENLFMFAILF